MNINISEENLKKILLAGSYITQEDLTEAEEYIKKKRIAFQDYLLQKNLIDKRLLGQAIAEAFKIPYADLESYSFPSVQVLKIPEDVAKKYRAVLFSDKKDEVIIATDVPTNPGLLPKLKEIFPQQKIGVAYALSEDLENIFMYYKKPLETRFSKIIQEKGKIASNLLREILNDAIAYKSSDIHFEPRKEFIRVRFRIDGVLHEAGRLPLEYYENILNRIKVQSGLRIDQHLTTQDGALRYSEDNKFIDFRTSIIPTIEGEKVVLRLLSSYVKELSLGDLGLLSGQESLLQEAASKPFGMIVVCGPTGAGKTTTLYGFIKLVNNFDVNITTIEDPVEYKTEGINQIQVNPKTDMTFAKGLRSIIRQDPDIILVGEIRDRETAEIAVNAALTGHLLYSTFHANDAATAIPRLLDMGIEPFMLASTLEVVVAQRLVRTICKECRVSVNDKPENLNIPQFEKIKEYFPGETITLYRGKGCNNCGSTGYEGRTGIFEIIKISPAMQELILKKPSTREILALAKKEGTKTMFEAGTEKVKNGITTIEELLRVTNPEQ